MKTLSILATFVAIPEYRNEVEAELLKLVEPTHSDEGCISYKLYTDNEDPNRFYFEEEWESEVLLGKHLETAHIKAMNVATEGKLVSFTVNKLTLLA